MTKFITLPAQVADVLRREIDRGAWNTWLPGERTLSQTFQVSRKTVRKALILLSREGRIKAEHGAGNKILVPKKKLRPVTDQSVALLTPDPLEDMRPFTSLWVNHLKTLLSEQGIRLRGYHGRKFFSKRPGNAVKKLNDLQPVSCYLLANSNESIQRWFSDHKVPCVVAGSCHPGIDLPHVDLDHYALCRHAAGMLLAAGHRQVALLNELSGRAGDRESEAGFIAGVRESPHADAVPVVIHHEHSPTSLSKVLQRLLEMPRPPTAMLVSNAASFLTVASVLAQRGLRIPEDISIVSRDDDPFLRFLIPPPARYTANPSTFAKKLLKPLLQSLHGESINPRAIRILPNYTRGESLGQPTRLR